MNLDNDLLKKMISETLSDFLNEATDEEITQKAEEVTEKEAAAAAAVEELAALQSEKTKEDADVAKEQSSMMDETLEITRGRLKQIIAEEMRRAKEQGII